MLQTEYFKKFPKVKTFLSEPINLRLNLVEIPKLNPPNGLTIDVFTSPEAESKENRGVWDLGPCAGVDYI
jgi:hypothetical protein